MKLKSKVLIIAGSDSSGGAGIQADIKTVTALGSYAMTAITAVTAQNTKGVKKIISIPTEIVQKQITMILDDIGTHAVKIGMLHNAEISKRLNVKKEEVVSMNRRLLGKEKSLNDPIKDGDGTEWQDWLVDNKLDQELKLSQEQEFIQKKKLMDSSMSILNPREKEILTARRLSDNITTLEKLSKRYKVSRERIRQIETKAFEKLQRAMLYAAKSNNLLPKN